jgi:Fe-S cluster assembly scaffold protein SufB
MASQFLSEKREAAATVKKLSEDIEALRKQLQIEQEKRQDLEELIKSQLANVIQKIETDYDTGKFLQKISELQSRLDEEVNARAKLTLWIKDNIGTTFGLDLTMTLIRCTPCSY